MFKTKDLVQISLLASISYVLSMLVVFRMANGGSVTLYLFPLFLVAFYKPLKYGLFCGFVVATLQVIFGGYILNPVQVILDYYFPVMIISSIKIIPIPNNYARLFIAFALALASYVTSGVIFFQVEIIAAISYNLTFFLPTIALNLIIFIAIKERLIPYLK